MFLYEQTVKSVFVYISCLTLCRFCEGAKEGDECYDASDKAGSCTALTNCDYAINLIEKGTSPVFCSSEYKDNFNALVCCLDSSQLLQQQLRKRISVEKCEELYPELLGPDPTWFAAVGGTKALAKEYKHMALVGHGDKGDISWSCGGSLISDKYVLTAAHCIYSKLGTPEWVRLGELDTSTDTDVAEPQDFAIVKSVVYPDYQPSSFYHDIGLLELERQVTYNDYIRPACLDQISDTSTINLAIATGWGHTSFAGQPSSHLIEVYLSMVNNSRCRNFFQGIPRNKLSHGVDEKTQICAGGNNGRDTCEGDSGGPLQVLKSKSQPLKRIFDIVGITSFGLACGVPGRPAVYTKVSFYIDWIESIVWP